jgi:V/A-type H+-transporting ATPase subunit I
MSRIRVMGPRVELPSVLQIVQDIGVLHLTSPAEGESLRAAPVTGGQERLRRNLQRIIADIDAAFQSFPSPPPRAGGTAPGFASGARRARRIRREAESLLLKKRMIDEERALIVKYQGFFRAFEELLRHPGPRTGSRAFHVLLRPGQDAGVPRLRRELEIKLGPDFELWARPMASGETALLLMVPESRAPEIERVLSDGRIQEVPLPLGYGTGTLTEVLPRMLQRLAQLPAELTTIEAARRKLAVGTGAELARLRQAAHDSLGRLSALALSGFTTHVFVLEGWLPARERASFTRELTRRAGANVVVETVNLEKWVAEGAPVVLANPRLFRPFEVIVRMLPLPRYGSIDPTPFVAVFFPMFFGVVLGDIGYGLMLGLGGWILSRRSRPGTAVRSLAEIGRACAVFSIIFGALYGEFFGDLGRRWFGLHHVLFDREEAVVPFLVLAVSLGLVHILLGLVLGTVAAHTRRERLGHGISAAMVVLIVLALMAAFRVLPPRLVTPAVIALLVAFPVLVIAEGLIAPVELLSTLGNILSYSRIMALGTASVMLAVVANRMTGAIGSVTVGILFALLFHLVNFALGLFSPTIHALRLHYVEFFGKFYSPGGIEYAPLAHAMTPNKEQR